MSDIHCSEADAQERVSATQAEHEAATSIEALHSSLNKPAVLAVAVASAALAACGGGDDANNSGGSEGVPGSETRPVPVEQRYITEASKPDQLEAWRFLNQATFGPKTEDAEPLTSLGYVKWIEAQMQEPQAVSMFALTKDNYNPERTPLKIGPLFADPLDSDSDKRKGLLDRTHVSSAWWEKALTGKDQLRQRVAYALSQILVIGMPHGGSGDMPYACASYYDLLLDGAFGSFPDLLTKVSGHSAMAVYLSSISNKRPVGSRIPDQNFAREIMQLFSIGLQMLNMDGTPQLVGGKPVETYTPYDIEVLSHVFTGWGWYDMFEAYVIYHYFPDSQTKQMKAYPQFHSTYDEFPKKDASGRVIRYPNAGGNVGSVTFLGKPLKLASAPGATDVTSAADVAADRQAALDIVFAHPNVAPFIAKQMIQWLVTSNPSTGYVGRVSQIFKSSNLNLGALVKAILLDKEARDATTARNDPTFGRLREPILRVTQFMRAFSAKSVGGKFHVPSLAGVSGSDIAACLGQSPLESPSVFNFYRPGYMAPNSLMAAQGKVTPEMQISSETEVAAYMRFMEVTSLVGFGRWVKKDGLPIGGNDTDQKQWSFRLSVYPDYESEVTLSRDQSKPATQRRNELIDIINKKLFGGTMSPTLKNHLTALADKFSYGPADGEPLNDALVRFATLTYVSAVAPEYVVQR
jgi:uncharacterized protein (DUF1800 family)